MTSRLLLGSALLVACTAAAPRPTAAPAAPPPPSGRWSQVRLPEPRGASLASWQLQPPIPRSSQDCSETRGARTASLASLGAGVVDHALAARGDTAALAWVTGPGAAKEGSPPEVHIAILSVSAMQVGRHQVQLVPGATGVALAGTPTGYVLAVWVAGVTSSRIELSSWTPALEPTDAGVTITAASDPQLASRPDGYPLLLYWVSVPENPRGGLIVAALLDERNRPVFETPVFETPNGVDPDGAVFSGDGFVLAQREGGVVTARLGLDGGLGQRHWGLGSSTGYARLAWDGRQAMLTFYESVGGSAVRLTRLDAAGAPVGHPYRLEDLPVYSNASAIASAAERTTLLLGGRTDTVDVAVGLDVVAFDGEARVVGPACRLFPTIVAKPRLARLGDGFVASWLDHRSDGKADSLVVTTFGEGVASGTE